MRAAAYILTLRDARTPEPTLEDILAAVAEITRVPVKEMLAHRRFRPYSRARMIFYYAATVLTSHKEEAISHTVNRERSAASHGKCLVQRERDRFEPELSTVMARFQPMRQAA